MTLPSQQTNHFIHVQMRMEVHHDLQAPRPPPLLLQAAAQLVLCKANVQGETAYNSHLLC